MALLEDCFFCSLSVAASVIGVYTLVAYLIAFLMETWWIIFTPVPLPSPAYVLCAGYLLVTIFSVILLRGLSIKKSFYLLLWLLVVAALFVPEGVLVYFMSIHYWNIRSLYGLMELTWWICRSIVNVSGMICVQSLYSNWREEKEVIRRLRDLNMTRVIPNRRNSVSSQANGYAKGAAQPAPTPPPHVLNNGAFVPALRRSPSMVSVLSRSSELLPTSSTASLAHPMMALAPNEFNASHFDLSLVNSLQGVPMPMPMSMSLPLPSQQPEQPLSKSHSLMDLRSVSSEEQPRKTMSVVDFPIEKKRAPRTQTQSLDRRLIKTPFYWNAPPTQRVHVAGRLQNAYFPPVEVSLDPRDSYGRNINSFYPGKLNWRSRQSVGSDSDDFQKYRDIAL